MKRWLVGLCIVLALCAQAAMAEVAEPERIIMSFAGDCTLGTLRQHQNYTSGIVETIRAMGMAHPFSGVKHIFEADDLTLVNLEGPLTNSRDAVDKLYVFRAPPEFAQVLTLGSVEAVNIANNHIDDYRQQGREDTLAALDAEGIVYSGEGIVAVYEVKGVRIGMAGYTYSHKHTLENLEKHDLPLLRAAGCDLIIFSMHAGTEEDYKITGTQKTLARGAIDLGVDIVVGHHPHVVHGAEIYKGKPIFYSLGNFAFGGNVNPPDWDSMIGQVVAEKMPDGSVRLAEMRIIPCLISGATRRSDFRPVVATGERAEKILSKIRRYSPDRELALFDSGVQSLYAAE